MVIHWIRHGLTTAPDDFCIGQEDVRLSEAGRRAISMLATSWTGPPPDRIVSSDLTRAEASARLLADDHSTPVATDGRLREMDFGAWNGRPWDAIEEDHPERLREWMQDWVETPAPGGESFSALARRIKHWREEMTRTLPGRAEVVAVAHAGTIRAALCQALDLPLDRAFHLQVDCAGVSTVVSSRRGWRVACLNAPRFLDRDLDGADA
jgi:alpha-ribazole phosphatase